MSLAALLEVDFRAPSLDYNELIKLTRVLTRKEDDIERTYRRFVFNALIHNQDDHAKSYSFIYNEAASVYRLSPAYDIAPGRTYHGEQTASVNGKGKSITDEDVLNVAESNRIDILAANRIMKRCKEVLGGSKS